MYKQQMIEYVDKIEAMNLSLGRKTAERLEEHLEEDTDTMTIGLAEYLNNEHNGLSPKEYEVEQYNAYDSYEHLEALRRDL